MPEEGERRWPKWLLWVVIPLDILGFYFAAFGGARLLGVALVVAGLFLTYYFALVRKPV